MVANQQKAWMDDFLMVRYLKEIWVPHVRSLELEESILTMDSFKAHVSDSVIQPLDVCLNKPFKVILRKLWQDYILHKTEANTASEKIPPPSRQDIVNWVEVAWKAIKEEADAIRKSFTVIGISATVGTWEEKYIRDDQLRGDIDAEMSRVFGDAQLSSADGRDPFDMVGSSDSEASSEESEADSYQSEAEGGEQEERSPSPGAWSLLSELCD